MSVIVRRRIFELIEDYNPPRPEGEGMYFFFSSPMNYRPSDPDQNKLMAEWEEWCVAIEQRLRRQRMLRRKVSRSYV